MTSSAGVGTLNNIVSLAPSGLSDFSALGALWDEWRLLGAEIKFFCAQQNSLTVQSQPIVVVYDNDDASTALTTLTSALDYRLKKQFATIWDNQSFPTLRATAYSTADPSAGRSWLTTGNTTGFICSFKVFSTGNSVSTVYLSYTVQAVLQFRGST
jgi:hypothetical protein